MAGKGLDKRKYPRLDIKAKVNISALDITRNNLKSKRTKATSKNIGVHGIQFISKKDLTVGDIACLEIYFPGEDAPTYIEGEVRWCNKVREKGKKRPTYNVGINFLTIEKEHVERILKYVCGDLA